MDPRATHRSPVQVGRHSRAARRESAQLLKEQKSELRQQQQHHQQSPSAGNPRSPAAAAVDHDTGSGNKSSRKKLVRSPSNLTLALERKQSADSHTEPAASQTSNTPSSPASSGRRGLHVDIDPDGDSSTDDLGGTGLRAGNCWVPSLLYRDSATLDTTTSLAHVHISDRPVLRVHQTIPSWASACGCSKHTTEVSPDSPAHGPMSAAVSNMPSLSELKLNTSEEQAQVAQETVPETEAVILEAPTILPRHFSAIRPTRIEKIVRSPSGDKKFSRWEEQQDLRCRLACAYKDFSLQDMQGLAMRMCGDLESDTAAGSSSSSGTSANGGGVGGSGFGGSGSSGSGSSGSGREPGVKRIPMAGKALLGSPLHWSVSAGSKFGLSPDKLYSGVVDVCCAYGGDIVDWLLARAGDVWGVRSRAHAVALGECLVSCGLITFGLKTSVSEGFGNNFKIYCVQTQPSVARLNAVPAAVTPAGSGRGVRHQLSDHSVPGTGAAAATTVTGPVVLFGDTATPNSDDCSTGRTQAQAQAQAGANTDAGAVHKLESLFSSQATSDAESLTSSEDRWSSDSPRPRTISGAGWHNSEERNRAEVSILQGDGVSLSDISDYQLQLCGGSIHAAVAMCLVTHLHTLFVQAHACGATLHSIPSTTTFSLRYAAVRGLARRLAELNLADLLLYSQSVQTCFWVNLYNATYMYASIELGHPLEMYKPPAATRRLSSTVSSPVPVSLSATSSGHDGDNREREQRKGMYDPSRCSMCGQVPGAEFCSQRMTSYERTAGLVVGGHFFSLLGIEQGILRLGSRPDQESFPFRMDALPLFPPRFTMRDARHRFVLPTPVDPRFHFVLCRPTMSSPVLTLLLPNNMHDQVVQATQLFLQRNIKLDYIARAGSEVPSGSVASSGSSYSAASLGLSSPVLSTSAEQFRRNAMHVVLPESLLWYRRALGRSEADVVLWVAKAHSDTLENAKMADFIASNTFSTAVTPYDWTVSFSCYLQAELPRTESSAVPHVHHSSIQPQQQSNTTTSKLSALDALRQRTQQPAAVPSAEVKTRPQYA